MSRDEPALDAASADRVLNAFLLGYLEDRASGTTRPLSEYQARFPGHEALIAASYADIAADRPGDESAARPASIGHYRVLGELGRGGQGVVYLAEDQRLRRRVALKVLSGLGSMGTDRLARFLREADVASRVDHSGIATVYEVGIDAGTPFIAMQYVDGETLATRIAAEREARLRSGEAPHPSGSGAHAPSSEPARVASTIGEFEHLARALHAAHERGIVHRDVKPGNIMLSASGAPILLDFGLAQDTDAGNPTLTLTGDFLGTPAYMSPEQISSGSARPDRRTDVYSLGVALFECLTLRRPFDAPTREALYRAILASDPPDAAALNRAVPKDLAVVVATAIAKDRDRRYQTAQDFAEDLRRVRMRQPILARPAGRMLRLFRWAQREPALASAVVLLIAVLTAGLATALFLLGEVTAERNHKQAALTDYDRLGDWSRLQRLQAEAATLWPSEPAKAAAMRRWVDQAAQLAQRLDGHRAALAGLRRSGVAAAADSRTESRLTSAQAAWCFESDAMQFKHDTTARLVLELEAFVDLDPHKGLAADVRKRLAFAETVERATVGAYAEAWSAAVRSIADRAECPKYGGLAIEPRVGLVPIGRDPVSGLWEFAHLETTAPGADPVPRRGPDGRLAITDSTGLVFVLLPGGTFRMGAMRPPDDETPLSAPNVDVDAEAREAPVTSVTLDPFYISKYEMTQGQWLRVTGQNPSSYGAGEHFKDGIVGLTNPVEQVSWDDCDLWLGRLGLAIPTEAQWEYSARGGTATPRWTGIGTDGLAEAANIADEFCRKNGGPSNWVYAPWSDGHVIHTAVGSLAPNPFGLHDVLGNVSEWCRDGFAPRDRTLRAGDGLASTPGSRNRMYRGGSFSSVPTLARSAGRIAGAPDLRDGVIGIRPAMALR